MATQIHQPHDKLFYLAMQDTKIAKDFFQAHLPPTLAVQLDLDTLRLCDSKLMSPAYKKFEADLVYEAEFKPESQGQTQQDSALFLLHCEHYTRARKDAPLSVWQYLLLLCQRYHGQNRKRPLPVIYPMIVYTGKRPYHKSAYLFDLFGEHKALVEQLLLRPIQVIDVCRLDDNDIRQRQWAGLVEFAFKHRDCQNLAAFLDKLFPWVEEIELRGGENFVKMVLYYIIDRFSANDTETFIQKSKEHLSGKLRSKTMTIAEQFIYQGRQEGRQEGRRQGLAQGKRVVARRLLKKGFSLAETAEITDLSATALQTLLEEQTA